MSEREAGPSRRPPLPPLYASKTGEAEAAAAYAKALADLPYAHEERLADTSFGTAHVLVAGRASAPPLVVWHGFGVPSPFMVRMFDSWVEQGRFCIYLPDHPYQTGSRSQDCLLDPSQHEHGKWALEVLQGLGLVPPPAGNTADSRGNTDGKKGNPKAPLHVGVSYGGAVIFDLAQVAPEAVRGAGLVVAAGLSRGPLGSWAGILRVILPSLLYRLLPCRLTAWLPLSAMCDEPDPSNPSLHMVLLGWRHAASWAQLPGGNGGFSPEQLRRLTAPTIVIAAENDIFAPGAAVAKAAEAALPECETVVIPGAKHLPSKQRLAEAAEQIASFFAAQGLL